MWNEDQELKLLLSIYITVVDKRYAQLRKAETFFEFELWKIVKYDGNNMLSKVRQKIKNTEK